MIPFDILLERLKKYDEVVLCELLDISAEELVEAFEDRIKKRRSFITKELELADEVESEAEPDWEPEDDE